METIKTFIEGIKAKDIADIFISIAILVIFFVLHMASKIIIKNLEGK